MPTICDDIVFIVPIENLRGLVMGDREAVAVAAASASASATSSGPRLSSMVTFYPSVTPIAYFTHVLCM
jgi:hypothetical protein